MPNDRSYKILLLTDSAANPRSFPPSMVVKVEETYPYLLRNEFRAATFYQLSFGNITTEDLISQAMSYLSHWEPDFIIVQSGMSDCRPEAFTEAEKAVINRLPGPFRQNEEVSLSSVDDQAQANLSGFKAELRENTKEIQDRLFQIKDILAGDLRGAGL